MEEIKFKDNFSSSSNVKKGHLLASPSIFLSSSHSIQINVVSLVNSHYECQEIDSRPQPPPLRSHSLLAAHDDDDDDVGLVVISSAFK